MYCFIVNEKSRTGKGSLVWEAVKRVLEEKKTDYKAWITEYEGHAVKIAEEICTMEEDINLIVVGGDGTINEVLNGITDFKKIRFGVIPTGSGNDYARGMGIKGSTEELISKIIESTDEELIDLGQVSWEGCEKPRLFAISAGIGLDAIVCKKALTSKIKKFMNKIHLGKLTYLVLTVQSLFSMNTMEAKGRFDNDTKGFHRMIFAAAMNLRAEGGGVPMAPDASPKDGKLSVCTISGIPKWRTFFCLPVLVAAKHKWLKGVEIIDCESCRIHIKEPAILHADGEYCCETRDVVFKCNRAMLRVIKQV